MKWATKTEQLDNIILCNYVWDCKKILTTGKWKLWSMSRHCHTDVWKILLLWKITCLWHLLVLITVWILKSYTEHGLESRLRHGGNHSQWWQSLPCLHLQRLLRPVSSFNPVVTFHFWAVLVIWQHTLSCFAYFHEGVWMVCKAAGADGHERLYPWFPQQDTVSVVSWSILFTSIDGIRGLWPVCECTTEAAHF